MASTLPRERVEADDEMLRRVLDDAFLPALLPALAHATGDLGLLQADLRPTMTAPGAANGGMTPEQTERAKALAFDALRKFVDGGCVPAPSSEATVRTITDWITGAEATDEQVRFFYEELQPDGVDPRAPAWHKDPQLAFSVVIVGAGMSGIVSAVRLKQAGVPFTIIEKNADVGGTWYENTYPGARVDVSNAFYSYSFAQDVEWPNHFSPQQVLLDYFREVVERYGLSEHIRFGTEVVEADWDDDRKGWHMRLRSSDGREETMDAQAIICATGQLNRPKMPQIEGMDSFAGPSFHSARWDHTVDLKGKRIAVIGTGASAVQFVPEIAPDAAHVDVYQRTPPWFFPVPHYHDAVPEGMRWLFHNLPTYEHWYRSWLFWTTSDGLLPAVEVDEGWPANTEAVGERNEELRKLLSMVISAQFADRPDLLPKALPKYPPGAKRIVLDNGSWAQALKRDNVRLISDGIREIARDGVVTPDGELHPADVIIYGTGFRASHFMAPMKVVGSGGASLEEQWSGEARAYLGVTVPNMPNFFMLYGPNTNIVVNGSIIYFSECGVQYILGCLKMLFDGHHRALQPKRDVHDAYNERIDAANRQRAWGASTVNSWYKNDNGRVSQNWPFNLIEYWRCTKEPDPADYDFV
jgi:4-hydroxyacetophenone monooxygenase